MSKERTIVWTLLVISISVPAFSQEKPNIVLILADALGYASLNSYGADKNLVRTPHIDRIAEVGMRFTDAHTPASICTLRRYGLITGRYLTKLVDAEIRKDSLRSNHTLRILGPVEAVARL